MWALPVRDNSTMAFASSLKYDIESKGDDVMTLFLQNIINEKIYLAVWFWYAFLVPYAILAMFFRLFTIFFDKIRFNLIYKTVRF